MNEQNYTCDLCGKGLLDYGTWTDDEEYGDVHSTCLEQVERGIDKADLDPEAA